MSDVKILSGGAAHGLVLALEARFRAETGSGISGSFGAVGGMRQRILDGEAVDLAILTRAIIAELDELGRVMQGSIVDLGRVATAIAVPEAGQIGAINTADDVRAALLAASAIYFPDPKAATAGIHFHGVMDRLGILDAVSARLRPHPNGATAMRAMAESGDAHAIGCTQATEIISTPGVRLVASLPGALALETIYTAAILSNAAEMNAASRLTHLLSAPEQAEIRAACGFLPIE